MQSANMFPNPYAVEVVQMKKKELIEGISNTEHLLNLLIDKGILPAEKKVLVLHYRTREERNSRVLDILVSQGERACRLFFFPCLKLAEPDLYKSIRTYIGGINENVRDARRQLIGYLLERDHKSPFAYMPEAKLKKSNNLTNKPKLPGNTIGPSAPSKAKAGEDTTFRDKKVDVFAAAATGQVSLLAELLNGKDIDAVNLSQETLLHTAAQNGQVSIVQLLLSRGAKLEERDSQGRTALHRAAEAGNPAVAKTLLMAGADIYALDNQSNMPVDLASVNQHLSTVKLIVEEEIKRLKNQGTFLHMAAMKDNFSLSKTLLTCGSPVDAKDSQRRTALFHAVNRGFERTAEVLLKAGAKVGKSVMETAFNLNSQPMLSLLLKHAKELSPDILKSALFRAVQENTEGLISALVDRGANVNALNDLQYTPLLLAAELGNAEAFEVLIAKKARVENKLQDGNSALHLAVQSGQPHITKLVLEKGLDANAAGSQGQRSLHLCALYNQHSLVELLLNAGARVNAVGPRGLTPLHVASQQGHPETVAELLKGKADVRAKDEEGRTALHLAAGQAHASTVQLLLSAGCEANAADKEKKTPLHFAATRGNAEVLSALLANKANFKAKDMDGCTALHYAAASGQVGVAAALLSCGKNKNVNEKNVWRKTPLHLASEHGQDSTIDLLLSAGANINALDTNKDSPLHSACRYGHLNAVQRLASWTQGHKANLQAKNNVHKTPLQVAQSESTQDHQNIVTFLQKKMFLIK